MITHETEFGIVTIGADTVSVTADGWQLRQWATRPGSAWPCSALAASDGFGVSFDTNGVVEYHDETDELMDDLSGDELSAWSSDAIGAILPIDHPCHFVVAGQFRDGSS